MECTEGVKCSHFSKNCLDALEIIRGRGRVLACIERKIASTVAAKSHFYTYEVRITIREGDGHWYHYCINENNWQQPQKIIVRQQDIFPSALNPRLKIFSPRTECERQRAEIKPLNPAYIGWVPNIKLRFYREILVHQMLDELKIPGIGKYFGCVVENGLVTGIAYRRYSWTLNQALAANVPCHYINSKGLVDATTAMQQLGVMNSPINPESVVLDRKMCLVLTNVECAFESNWCGGTKALAMVAPKYTPVNHSYDYLRGYDSPLNLIFAKLCSAVHINTQPNMQHSSTVQNSCGRSACICSGPLKRSTSFQHLPPALKHHLWISASDLSKDNFDKRRLYNKHNLQLQKQVSSKYLFDKFSW
ncbi:hypothetical protein COEREDRAFT_87998 [Coemansia reversa NRRL 1564]|uniref:Uncharacterized protein n=1 Tax=Coemansia reversa (strain ATCC 12441 / NRRL 1564) TaxID=763665 RepID=A0A2G5B8M5_COERN|nr:hypothetical protein COEREDRAFT_87998 [Coemansia reversa NRRL 1564]|eukprot:PIA15383.1 hypothetical protein COEREDRAFT_87998 [Coemansia reversa NRRL 1564]